MYDDEDALDTCVAIVEAFRETHGQEIARMGWENALDKYPAVRRIVDLVDYTED